MEVYIHSVTDEVLTSPITATVVKFFKNIIKNLITWIIPSGGVIY